jgi:hypothetical protein
MSHFFLEPELLSCCLVISVKLDDEHSNPVSCIGYALVLLLVYHALASMWISPPTGLMEDAGVNVKVATLSEPAYPTIEVDVKILASLISPSKKVMGLLSTGMMSVAEPAIQD